MSNFFETWANKSEARQKLVEEERLILKVSEAILEKMEEPEPVNSLETTYAKSITSVRGDSC